MKWFLCNTIYKVFIVATFPIALLEILFKNISYGLQLSWTDLKKELLFVWESLKWGLDQEQRKQQQIINKYMGKKKENN